MEGEDMMLPDFLTEVGPGEIRLTGHRIGLYHVIADHKKGYSAERLHEEFPTLSLGLIEQVLMFYRENQAEVDEYVNRYEEEADRICAATPRAVSYDELLRRFIP
jgi:uncharacterized protein (DUF433 family)